MKTLLDLMEGRHEAYLKAEAGEFKNEADTKAWRVANREYVQRRIDTIKSASQTPQSRSMAA
jgi:hypothetical protein